MAERERLICPSELLPSNGKGIRFEVETYGLKRNAFAVRYQGKVYAYVNECAHVPVELDWNEGDFFDLSGLYLVCATHGAYYAPESGVCLGGPCKGRSLVKLNVVERDGHVYLINPQD